MSSILSINVIKDFRWRGTLNSEIFNKKQLIARFIWALNRSEFMIISVKETFTRMKNCSDERTNFSDQ